MFQTKIIGDYPMHSTLFHSDSIMVQSRTEIETLLLSKTYVTIIVKHKFFMVQSSTGIGTLLLRTTYNIIAKHTIL